LRKTVSNDKFELNFFSKKVVFIRYIRNNETLFSVFQLCPWVRGPLAAHPGLLRARHRQAEDRGAQEQKQREEKESQVGENLNRLIELVN